MNNSINNTTNEAFTLHRFVNSRIIYYIILYIFHVIIIFTHSRLNSKHIFHDMAGRIFSLLSCCPGILPVEMIHKGKNVLKCVEMCAFDERIPISGFDIV